MFYGRMPNPRHSNIWPNIPLLEHIGGATHVKIMCRCGREITWLTRELVEKVPGAETCSEYQERMKCARCGLRGWVIIRPIGRR